MLPVTSRGAICHGVNFLERLLEMVAQGTVDINSGDRAISWPPVYRGAMNSA